MYPQYRGLCVSDFVRKQFFKATVHKEERFILAHSFRELSHMTLGSVVGRWSTVVGSMRYS